MPEVTKDQLTTALQKIEDLMTQLSSLRAEVEAAQRRELAPNDTSIERREQKRQGHERRSGLDRRRNGATHNIDPGC